MYAVPAYSRKVALQLPDGTEAVVQMSGDENFHWALTEDGYTVLATEQGWMYAMADNKNNAIPSSFPLTSFKNRDDSTKRFLSTLSKNIKPDIKKTRQRNMPYRGKTRSVTGDRRVLVVLVAFSDLSFRKSNEDFIDLFNQAGYSHDGAKGSVYDYYNEVSCGKLQLHSDIIGPCVLEHSMKFYGGNDMQGIDKNPTAMFQEALNYAASQVNLSDYDADDDGYLDNLHIIFAGYGEEAGANGNAIWSHEGVINPISIQNVKVDRYSCTPELRGNRGDGISRIGVCCHEIGHALGAMDYYDTDYTINGEYPGTGEWDVMGSGSWNNDGVSPARFNPYVRAYDFGWVEVETLTQQNNNYEIQPSTAQNDDFIKLETGSPDDFYLLENRIQQGFDSAIPGEGLMIYHVHPDIERYAQSNTINAAFPMMMYPVCASSKEQIPSTYNSYGNINSDGCPFPGSSVNSSFGSLSTPAAFSWNGTKVSFSLNNIQKKDNGNVIFSLSIDDEYLQENKWNTIMIESFETSPFNRGWNCDSTEGINTTWTHTGIDNTNINQIANWYTLSDTYDGKYCMSVLHKGMIGDVYTNMYSPYYSCKSSEEIRITFSALSKKRYNGKTKLIINIEDENGIVVQSNEINNISTLSWETITMIVPENVSKFRIVFGAEVNYASINIDYFCIQVKENESTFLNSIFNDINQWVYINDNSIQLYNDVKNQKVNIFDTNGNLIDCLEKSKTQSTRLSSGIYIIKTNDYTKKIYIP